MAKPKEDRRTAGTYARLTEASMEQVKEIARIGIARKARS